MNVFSQRAFQLFAVALIFRVGIFVAMPLPGYSSDSFAYVSTAKEIAAGHGFQFVRDGVASPMLLTEPGYSLFLGFWYFLGITQDKAVLLIQAILAALLAPAIYAYVLRRSTPAVATAAALVYALDPLATSSCFFLLREIFVMLVVLTGVFALDLIGKWSAVPKGCLLGAGTLSFPLLGLWSNVLWVWDRWLSPKRRSVTVWVVLVAWAVFGLWALRNLMLSEGNYAFRRNHTGILVYYTATYDFPWLPNPNSPDFKKVVDDAAKRFDDGFTVQQRSLEKEILKATWETFAADPVKVACRFMKANFWFWAEVPGAMGMLESKPTLHRIFLAYHGAQMIFFLVGLGFMFKLGDAAAFRFVWGTVLYLAFFNFWFMPIPRYYVPFLPLIDIVAAYGAVRLFSKTA